jgi:hypothetical protein
VPDDDLRAENARLRAENERLRGVAEIDGVVRAELTAASLPISLAAGIASELVAKGLDVEQAREETREWAGRVKAWSDEQVEQRVTANVNAALADAYRARTSHRPFGQLEVNNRQRRNGVR